MQGIAQRTVCKDSTGHYYIISLQILKTYACHFLLKIISMYLVLLLYFMLY